MAEIIAELQATATALSEVEEALAYHTITVAEDDDGATVLTFYSSNGTSTSVTISDGEDGKDAYEYAVDGGYTGTEDEFAEALATIVTLINAEESEY